MKPATTRSPFLSSSQLPEWRRALLLLGPMVSLFAWVHHGTHMKSEGPLTLAIMIGTLLVAVPVSFVNHVGAQLAWRGVAWFQLLLGTTAAVGVRYWEPALIAVGAGVAMLAAGTTGLGEREDVRGSFAPVAFRRSLMVSIVMATAEVQMVAVVTALLWNNFPAYRFLAAPLAGLALLLVLGAVGLYRLRVWGLLSLLLALAGVAALVTHGAPTVESHLARVLVWTMPLVVQVLLPLPLLLVILGRTGRPRTTASPWPARLFRVLVVGMMLAATIGALSDRS